MKFDFFADPGHGWVKVPKSLIKKLGIEEKITIYSYTRKNHVYLEEDGDLTIFITAMKAAGKTVEFRQKHTDQTSRIRRYQMYQVRDM